MSVSVLARTLTWHLFILLINDKTANGNITQTTPVQVILVIFEWGHPKRGRQIQVRQVINDAIRAIFCYYVKNDAIWRHSYYGRLMRICMRCIE